MAILHPPDSTSPAASTRPAVHTIGYLAGQAGIGQFLDIGTGLPTANKVHEIAQSIAPQSRFVYLDNDPIVLPHARALLAPAALPAARARPPARPEDQPRLAQERPFLTCWERLTALPAPA